VLDAKYYEANSCGVNNRSLKPIWLLCKHLDYSQEI
jgi:hypothetical protein